METNHESSAQPLSAFRDFERDVVRTLVGRHRPESEVEAVLASAPLASYEHTGSGYYLTVRHPAIPAQRIVCHQPVLIGKAGDLECGFVVFLEAGELTLECHSWGDERLPEDFRERHVEIA